MPSRHFGFTASFRVAFRVVDSYIGASKSFQILCCKSNVFYDPMELMQLSHYDLKGRQMYY